MGISLLEDAGIVKVYLMPGREAEQFTEHTLARPEYSDRLWPSPGGAPICIRDSTRELDLSYPIDRRVVDAGRRSVLAISLEAEGRQLGVLWFDSHHVDAFKDDDAIALGPVADLLAVAVAHDRLWSLEQQRRLKRDQLESLLPMIDRALDVRTVFSQISDVIQDVIPHVTVSLALLTPDRKGVKVHVASNYDVGDLPEYRFTSESETISAQWRSFVAYDCTVVEEGVVRARVSPAGADEPAFVELRPGAPWTRILSRLKLRSLLSVPIRIRAGNHRRGVVWIGQAVCLCGRRCAAGESHCRIMWRWRSRTSVRPGFRSVSRPWCTSSRVAGRTGSHLYSRRSTRFPLKALRSKRSSTRSS